MIHFQIKFFNITNNLEWVYTKKREELTFPTKKMKKEKKKLDLFT
jgi:hypothetical protein